MNFIEKFKSNPKNVYYAIAGGAFILINIVGLILYQAKNSDKEMKSIKVETITEEKKVPTPTDGPIPTDWPTPTPEPSPSITPKPKATNTPTPTTTPTPISPTPTIITPTPISPTPSINLTPTVGTT